MSVYVSITVALKFTMKISDQLEPDELTLFARILTEGAREGFYDEWFCDHGFCQNYVQAIHQQGIVPNNGREGLIFVCRLQGVPVCFAVIGESVVPGFDAEFFLLSVPKKERRRSYGLQAVKLILSELQGMSVLARCPAYRQPVIQLLIKCGFVTVDLKESATIDLGFFSSDRPSLAERKFQRASSSLSTAKASVTAG